MNTMSRHERMNGRGDFAGRAGLLILLTAVAVVAGCATPKRSGLDPVIKNLGETASAAYHAGALERADSLWQKALQRARLTDNRTEIARNSYNLGLCRIAEGRHAEAEGLLKQAEAHTGRKGVEASRILLALAELSRLQDAPADSEDLAARAVSAGPDRDGQVQAWLLRSEAAFAAVRREEALKSYWKAQSSVSGATPPLLMARMDGLALCLLDARLLSGDAATILVSRADWLKKAGQYGEMARALVAAADRYETDSKWKEAFDCLVRAAQSLMAADLRAEAAPLLQRASAMAEKTGNAVDKALLSELEGQSKREKAVKAWSLEKERI